MGKISLLRVVMPLFATFVTVSFVTSSVDWVFAKGYINVILRSIYILLSVILMTYPGKFPDEK